MRSLCFSGSCLLNLPMRRRIRCYTLYFRLTVLFILSISASVILLLITNERQHSYLTINERQHSYLIINERLNIADRIVLFVRTSHNCQSRLNYLLQSWISTNLSEQTNLYLITDYISNQTNSTILNSFQNIIETKCPQTHNRLDLCCKTANEFHLFYNLSSTKTNLEWMCRFDDDQYVNLNNLYKYLSKLNASKPYYIGRKSMNRRLKVLDDKRTFTFATYGAGVCFSYSLLEQLRPYMNIKDLPHDCLERRLSDDAYIGYLIELNLNISLTSINDLFHSHLEKLNESFRYFSLYDLTRMITFGFAWNRYRLEWLPIIHQLINLVNRNQIETANYLWLFLRNYEKEHPENLFDKYDQSCLSYQILRNQSMNLQTRKKIEE